MSDVNHTISDKALDDLDVKFYWNFAIGIEIADDLLKMVIDLYTTANGNKGFMNQNKQKSKTKAHRNRNSFSTYKYTST